MLSRMLTLQDPFQGFPFTTMPGVWVGVANTCYRLTAHNAAQSQARIAFRGGDRIRGRAKMTAHCWASGQLLGLHNHIVGVC
jgi:hypothetical protein